jgi:tetratricopeptide (TPR) repeat protein
MNTINERRDLSLLQLRNLWNSGNYSACAREAAAYSSKFFDAEINDYAFRSNMELANSLPPQKALTYFARAAYYYPDQSKENPGYVGLNKSLEKLRLIWQLSDTHMHYAGTAMLSGDEAAASGFMQPDYTNGEYQSFYDLLNRYSGLRRSVYGHVEGDPNKQKAIKPLESELEICLKAYGEHGDMLIPILSRLAECYRLSGENQKSITAYEKLLSIAPQGGPEYNREMLAYVDLLSQSGQGKRVPNILEKHLHKQGALDTNNPLLIRLIESYNAEHMSQQAQDALAELLETPKAVKFDPRYQFVDGSSIKPLAEGSLFSEGERQELQKSRGLDPFADAARQPPTKDSPNANSAGDANF